MKAYYGFPFLVTKKRSDKPPAYQRLRTDIMRAAHTKLTDGQTAPTNNLSHQAWVKIYRDSSELPIESYPLGSFCYYGLNIIGGDFFGKWPEIAANGILSARHDASWDGIQQKAPDMWNYSWTQLEQGINNVRNSGGTCMVMLGYTPAWANLWRMRQYPPMTMEEEVITLDSQTGKATLSKAPVVSGQWCREIVVNAAAPWVQATHETLAHKTNLDGNAQPRAAKTKYAPVSLPSIELRSPGILWQRVHPVSMPYANANKYFVADFQGYIRWGDGGFSYESSTSAPGPHDIVTINYQYISPENVYEKDLDYIIDYEKGEIKKIPPGIVNFPSKFEDFSGDNLPAGWGVRGAEIPWNVNSEIPGHLVVHPTLNRTIFYQVINDANPLESSYDIRVWVATINPSFTEGSNEYGNRRAGVVLEIDDDNYVHVVRTGNVERARIIYKISGGAEAFQQIAHNVTLPFWAVLRKRGPTLSAWISTQPNNWEAQLPYNQSTPLRFTLPNTYRVGIIVQDSPLTANSPRTIAFDNWTVKSPKMETDNLRVFYYALNTGPWVDYVQNMVNRFRDKVKHWEIWNEPDGGGIFFSGPLYLWAELVKSAYRAIKQIDPSAKVIPAGIQDSNTHRFRELYQYKLKRFMDYGSWHPYNYYGNSPDGFNWGKRYFETPQGINAKAEQGMADNRDLGRQVIFGEVANTGAVLVGQNYRKQADYTIRMVMMSRRLGYVRGFMYWPLVNQAVAQDQSGNNFVHGGREGLTYAKQSPPQELNEPLGYYHYPKPVWYAYGNMARNKGIMLDLVSYNGTIPTPADPQSQFGVTLPGVYPIKRIVLNSTLIDPSSVQVGYSRTCTADGYITPLEHGCQVPPNANQTGRSFHLIVATMGSGSENVKTEVFRGSCYYDGAYPVFRITGSVSGFVGIATAGVPFNSNNGAFSMTIPLADWATGNTIQFETFKGDGWNFPPPYSITTDESGNIVVQTAPPNTPVENLPKARYVYIQYRKAQGANVGYIGEVQVYDDNDNNVALNKLYSIEGIMPDNLL